MAAVKSADSVLLLFCAVYFMSGFETARAAYGITWRADPITGSLVRKDAGEVQCSQPREMTCDGCAHSRICVHMGGNNFLEESYEKCPRGQTCKAGTGCTDLPNEECTKPEVAGKFPCRALGVYPDPYDCRKYHFCPPKSDGSADVVEYSTQAKCPDGYGYDVETTFCSNTLADNGGECNSETVIKKCETLGQSEAISTGSSYFYVCLERTDNDMLYPHQYRCDHGETYAKSGKCGSTDSMKKIENSTKMDKLMIGDDDDSDESDSRQESTEDELTCERKGLMAHPEDCTSYYACRRPGSRPLRFKCMQGNHFDAVKGRCVRGAC